MKHTIDLEPFQIPNFVRPTAPIRERQDGWKETPAIPLSDLSVETLEGLCAEFRAGIFKKAGKVPNANHKNECLQLPGVEAEKPEHQDDIEYRRQTEEMQAAVDRLRTDGKIQLLNAALMAAFGVRVADTVMQQPSESVIAVNVE